MISTTIYKVNLDATSSKRLNQNIQDFIPTLLKLIQSGEGVVLVSELNQSETNTFAQLAGKIQKIISTELKNNGLDKKIKFEFIDHSKVSKTRWNEIKKYIKKYQIDITLLENINMLKFQNQTEINRNYILPEEYLKIGDKIIFQEADELKVYSQFQQTEQVLQPELTPNSQTNLDFNLEKVL